MYSIDGIKFENYGLYVSDHIGQANLVTGKRQLFTVYGREGYEITKRNGKVLSIKGYIIADDLADFQTKTSALISLFQSPNTREIYFDNIGLTCLSQTGYKIDKVHILSGMAYGRFQADLVIITEGNVTVFNPPPVNMIIETVEPTINIDVEFVATIIGGPYTIFEPTVTGDANVSGSLDTILAGLVEPNVSGDANDSPALINALTALFEPVVSGDSEFSTTVLNSNFAIVEPIVTTT